MIVILSRSVFTLGKLKSLLARCASRTRDLWFANHKHAIYFNFLDSYPGLWEVPMIDWLDLAGAPCSMVDACAPPGNEEEAIELYMKNFETHYATNRAPFPMFFHATWFAKYPHTFSGKLLEQDDLGCSLNRGTHLLICSLTIFGWIIRRQIGRTV
jgi:hypothetical protein